MLTDSPPIGGMTWSNSFILVRFQICFMMALSSSLACSKFPKWIISRFYGIARGDSEGTVFSVRFWRVVPSVLILSAVLTRANRVALKVTVPSLLRGMFIPTNLYGQNKQNRLSLFASEKQKCNKCEFIQMISLLTLHAARCGQNLPKPNGGWILRSSVTTSRCLILPL